VKEMRRASPLGDFIVAGAGTLLALCDVNSVAVRVIGLR
jgi:hypothetical protein